jgi:lysophospholipid acyltransferase (LPLAT)-like uncharacterized protein
VTDDHAPKERHEGRLPAREQPLHAARAGSVRPLDLRTRLAIWLGSWILNVLGRTWRIQVFGRAPLMQRAASDERVVFTLWHGQMLPLLWVHRQPTGVVVSEHRDGDIIAHALGRFGVFGIRGSTSRGGARALLECVRVLKSGADVVLTPDGPRGPRHSFAPGALIVALRAQAAVVPLVAKADRVWQLKSWDGFEIPKPFAKIAVLYGEPKRVQGTDVRTVAEEVPAFVAMMQAAADRVAVLAAEREG